MKWVISWRFDNIRASRIGTREEVDQWRAQLIAKNATDIEVITETATT